MSELSDGDPRLDQAAKREDYPTSLDAGLSWKMAVEADFQPGGTIHRGLEEVSTNLQRFPRARRTLGAPDGRMHKRWRHHAAEPRPEREPDMGDRARLLLGWGRELGGQVLALIDLLLGSAARNLKTPHTRTKASAWGEGQAS